MAEPKFITDAQGNPKRNPKWTPTAGQVKPAVIPSAPPMAQVMAAPTSVEEMLTFNEQHPDHPMAMPDAVQRAMRTVQQPQFAQQMQCGVDPLFEGLQDFFAMYEVPVGLLHNLAATGEYYRDVLLDDSASMRMADGSLMDGTRGVQRWQEMRQTLHVMVDVWAYVPCPGIRISFLNRDNVIEVAYNYATPDAFKADMHAKIDAAMAASPSGTTPVVQPLQALFARADKRSCRTYAYFFNDGKPDEGEMAVSRVVLGRNCEKIPMTLRSVSGNDNDVRWLKELEEMSTQAGRPSYLSESDDYAAEYAEVKNDQGNKFPYSFGFYLIVMLCGAAFPETLDAMDEGPPLTRQTLQDLLGRRMSKEEYLQMYFAGFLRNPNKTAKENATSEHLWGALQAEFCRDDITAHQIPAVRTYLENKRHS